MYYVIVDDVDVDVSNFINDDDYMVFFLFILRVCYILMLVYNGDACLVLFL